MKPDTVRLCSLPPGDVASGGGSRASTGADDLAAAKAALRTEMRERLRQVTPAVREPASRRVCEALRALPAFQKARALCFYMPLRTEVDIMPLAAGPLVAGQLLLLPRYNADSGAYDMVPVTELATQLVSGNYGILEPRPELPVADSHTLSDSGVTWLVPGLAFDRAGHRLGRGRGYYDRLLAGRAGCKVGVAFQWQLVASVPVTADDVRVDVVVTDRQAADAADGS
jgi:5-formyltetrahydrofolate cyclo-ligase